MEAVAMLNVLVSFAESFASLRVGCKPIGDSYLCAGSLRGALLLPPPLGSGFPSGRPFPPSLGRAPSGALLVPVPPFRGLGWALV